MNPALSRTERFETRAFEWVDARLPGGGPLSLSRRRFAAAKALREAGLPSTREEAWRFTPLTELLKAPLELLPAGEGEAGASLEGLPAPEGPRVVLAGEQVQVLGALPEGLEVHRLSALLAHDSRGIGELLGSLVTLEGRPFAALNTILFREGVVVRVAEGAQIPGTLQLIHLPGSGDAVAVQPRVLILAGAGSRASVAELFLGPEDQGYLTTPVAELHLSRGAHLEHLRVQAEGLGAFHLGALAARVAQEAHLFSRVVSLGARLSRLDLDVVLDGEGAECTLEGLYLASGRQLVDHHTVVDHVSPGATSREVYKGILDDRSRGVFDGTIFMRRGAQRSSGSQENRNLLLSGEAIVHTKPHLAIDADDVRASHGATVGQLDEDQLFYLRARGLDLQAARGILTYAFARELLERIPDAALREWVSAAVRSRLPEGERLGGVQ